MEPEPRTVIRETASRVEFVAMGASAGAIEALLALLPGLPSDYPLAIGIVVHTPPGRESALPELFAGRCALRIKEAEDKELAKPGVIYFAPPNYHLLLERGGYFSLSTDDPVMYSRPSIDVFFESVAEALGAKAAGVILTGANRDGAKGLEKICHFGGVGLVQDPQQAASPEMPRAARESCPGAQVATLAKMSGILHYLGRKAA